jgi:hypothetical protein
MKKYFLIFFIPIIALAQGSYPSTNSGVYGPAMNVTDLTPFHLDGTEMVSYRFRAKYTGQMSGIRVYVMGRTYTRPQGGYGLGNGGTWQISLRHDSTSNHTPCVGWMASMQRNHIADSVNSAETPFPLLTFNSPATIDSGTLYHVVFQNIDANPSANYTALNCFTNWPQLIETPQQPFAPNTDWMSLRANSPYTTWTTNDDTYGETPIMEYYYTDGHSTGWSYMESESDASIGGNNAVREKFTVTGSDKETINANVWIKKISGTGALSIALETGAGSTIETQTIAASGISSSVYEWHSVSWTSNRTLTNGSSYHLLLTAPSGTTYAMKPVRKDANYGFTASSMFSDGYAQYTTDGSTWQVWGSSPSGTHGYDVEFYFTKTTPSAPVATQIAVNAGNSQTATVSTAVAINPSVIVRDASDNPVSGVSVTFAVATGGGSGTGLSAITNISGIATVGSWTLGSAAGSNTMTATSTGLTGSPLTITATGTAVPEPPPVETPAPTSTGFKYLPLLRRR